MSIIVVMTPLLTIVSAYCVARLLSVPFHPPHPRVFLFNHEGLVLLAVRLAAVIVIALSWWEVREADPSHRAVEDLRDRAAVQAADETRVRRAHVE